MTAPSVREALELAAGILQDMIQRGQIVVGITGTNAYYIGEGVMPKIAAALATPPAPTPSAADTYLVWSNEHAAWWGPNRCGYNTHISHAGRYTRAEAIKICNGARGGREFNRNPSEVPIRLMDAEAFWTESGLQERYEREARDLDNDLCDGDPL